MATRTIRRTPTRSRTSRAGSPNKRKRAAPYKPYPWQKKALNDRSKILLLTGSAGGGKSRTGLEKLNAFMMTYSSATGLMVRKAREYASKSIVPFMRITVQQNNKRIVMMKSETHFAYPNDSVLYWGGMRDDGQREAIRSIGGDGALDIILVEEANAFSEDDFNELLARLRGKAAPWRQIILQTNPDAPSHWIYQRLILGGEASVHYSSADMNPANPDDYLETLESLTGVLKLRLADGKWTHAVGAVYDTFNADKHVIEWFDPPPEWKRIRAVDFGYVNPFVCQWWAIDHDGRMYLYREIYMSHRLVEEHGRLIAALTARIPLDEWKKLSVAEQIQALESDNAERITATVADHDAEDRATLEKYIYTSVTPAKKPIKVGIQSVQSRLKIAGDGKPRLFIMRGATVELDEKLGTYPKSTLEEFPAYIWQPVKDGRIAKEEPVDLHNHGMDTTRYASMYLDYPSEVRTHDSNPFFD